MENISLIKGCCPLDCPDTCSWVAQVKDSKVIRVEGAGDHPITRGGLCGKVRAYQDKTYAKERILFPMQRVGIKGSGEFKRISWAQAIETIAVRFAEIIQIDGPEALMPLHYLGSMGVVQRLALLRLFNALGASQTHGSICGAPMSALSAEGQPIGFDPEEFVDSRLIVLWGINVLSTGHHQWHFMKQARRQHGARIICIDPRETLTAKQCDQHISLRPGTDSILAYGIARIMLQEELADLEYARKVSSDFEAYCDVVDEWTVDRVSEICEIPEQIILALAREFSQARPAVIRCGVGPQQNLKGDVFVRSLSALCVLGGHWKKRGGGLSILTGPAMVEESAASPELISGNPRSIDISQLGPNLNCDQLSPAINGLMIWNMNPAVVLPNSAEVRRGLGRENLFTVVLEHFVTDTARYADILLPSTTQLEHFDVQGAWGHHYISVNNPAIPPVGESKSHGEVMRMLSKRMNLTDVALQASDEEIAAAVLPKDITLSELKAKGWIKCSPPRLQPDSMREKLKMTGQAVVAPDKNTHELLQLLTPKSHYFLNSSFANMPKQQKSQGVPTLDMSTGDATVRGLKSGQQVILKNGQGVLQVELNVTDAIHAGVVALPGKWWGDIKTTGAVGNLLAPSSWSPSGQPAYNDTFVRVERVI